MGSGESDGIECYISGSARLTLLTEATIFERTFLVRLPLFNYVHQDNVTSHQIQQDWKSRARRLVPFGIGQRKPKHFRDMAKVMWDNRDNLGYAWKVISQGVCDGCALGVAGLHDWTIKGTHLCMTRLNLLRLNTMPAMDHTLLADVSQLAGKRNDELREMGRLAYPMLREQGAKGFRRISW